MCAKAMAWPLALGCGLARVHGLVGHGHSEAMAAVVMGTDTTQTELCWGSNGGEG